MHKKDVLAVAPTMSGATAKMNSTGKDSTACTVIELISGRQNIIASRSSGTGLSSGLPGDAPLNF